ncbi:5-demethoxyubiquinol-8 5-hydroxylase UbiM [uncultured Sphingomonas sp.]|uniref:5-demethoxyubiquinol-8 5-hydroxylase UbiM n=1 Tax=uncultured Sphingomonas sp. TaxID=158754 RepID=UPI0025E73C8A|nr:5-demethoxyubiquinol-8 5-hydroxylase UbiM [uncultured Sphingomonas sp.]
MMRAEVPVDFDVIIVGGGPAGLAFARSLDGCGLRLAVVERQPLTALAAPADDGREIALTQRSIGILKELAAWRHLNAADMAALREARVLNGGSPFALSFDAGGSDKEGLGKLVPNHRIRHSLFSAVEGQKGLTILAGSSVASLRTDRHYARLTLDDGRPVTGRLLVAADTRMSHVRDQLGIRAEMNRLGRSMMVVRVAHDGDHHGIATEWFDHGQTIALLPLRERCSSFVLTLPSAEMEALAAMEAGALGRAITRRCARRLGEMRVLDRAHVYPLTTTYACHFAATRAALIGDAAVGMHPVTAHGFNLGLLGQATLARLIRDAVERGGDIASASLLRRYEAAHRLATRPLYTATNLIVGLYTDERPAAWVARHMTLRAGARLPFVRRTVSRLLMQH